MAEWADRIVSIVRDHRPGRSALSVVQMFVLVLWCCRVVLRPHARLLVRVAVRASVRVQTCACARM